jgi:hypothetical protein
MVLGLSWCGGAAEVGLLNVAATGRGPGCHAANMSYAICGGFLCGPLNCLAGSAIQQATVVSAGWVAWRRACNVRRVDASAQVEVRVNVVVLGFLENEGVVGLSKETWLSDGRCV